MQLRRERLTRLSTKESKQMRMLENSDTTQMQSRCGVFLTRADFRIRRVPSGYKIWQHVGAGWQALCDVYETRAGAHAAVETFLARAVVDVLPLCADRAVGDCAASVDGFCIGGTASGRCHG